MSRPDLKHVIVHLSAPIAMGNKDVAEGYAVDHGPAGVTVFKNPDGRGYSQFFPGHLVTKIEAVEDKA